MKKSDRYCILYKLFKIYTNTESRKVRINNINICVKCTLKLISLKK